jgi:hypothetical protein
MDAAAVRQQLTERLLHQFEESEFPDLPLLNRIESMISTREELERYAEILVAKTQDEKLPPTAHMLDRTERVLKLLQQIRRLEKQTRDRPPLADRIDTLPIQF